MLENGGMGKWRSEEGVFVVFMAMPMVVLVGIKSPNELIVHCYC